MLFREVRRVIALPGLHRLVFLILRCARRFLAVDLFLDMQPAFDDSVGMRLKMLLGLFHQLSSPDAATRCSACDDFG